MKAHRKIAIVPSCGGHLTEVRALSVLYQDMQHFYVINDQVALPSDMLGKTYTIAHSERDLKFFVNLAEAWRILRNEKPSVILSTGAGPIVPFAIVAKLFGIKVIFIETLARVSKPSLTGRIMYYLADSFMFQWKQLAQFFPGGRYIGPLV
jgi:beta-1,4-N-acetylglucosaminyltransferase